MQKMKWISLITLVALLPLAGCGKSGGSPSKGPVIRGVLVETPKLQEAFATASPDVQAQLSKVQMGIRYGEFQTAATELEKLAANPGLTEAQKKAAADVAVQIKEVLSKPPETPKQ